MLDCLVDCLHQGETTPATFVVKVVVVERPEEDTAQVLGEGVLGLQVEGQLIVEAYPLVAHLHTRRHVVLVLAKSHFRLPQVHVAQLREREDVSEVGLGRHCAHLVECQQAWLVGDRTCLTGARSRRACCTLGGIGQCETSAVECESQDCLVSRCLLSIEPVTECRVLREKYDNIGQDIEHTYDCKLCASFVELVGSRGVERCKVLYMFLPRPEVVVGHQDEVVDVSRGTT